MPPSATTGGRALRTGVTDRGRKAEVLLGVAMRIVTLGAQVGRYLAGRTGAGECFQVNLEVLLGEGAPVRPYS